MAQDILKSTTTFSLVFQLIASSDHIAGLTGKSGSVVVSLSKNGAAGGAPAGAITEVDATNLPGVYKIAGNATDSGTAGPLWLYAKDAASDPYCALVANVIDPAVANYGSNVVQMNAVSAAAITTIKAVQGLTTADTITAYTGNTVQTGDSYARIGAPAGASVSADVAAIQAKTTNLPAAPAATADCITAAGVRTAVGLASANVDTQLGTIAAYVDTVESRLPAALIGGRMDSTISAIDNDTTALAAFKAAVRTNTTGTVGAASSTTSIVTSSMMPAASVTDQFKGLIVKFDLNTSTAALRGQASDITASTAGGVLTVTALTNAPANGDTFTIL